MCVCVLQVLQRRQVVVEEPNTGITRNVRVQTWQKSPRSAFHQ
jgi:hypothetical protein